MYIFGELFFIYGGLLFILYIWRFTYLKIHYIDLLFVLYMDIYEDLLFILCIWIYMEIMYVYMNV